jgi:hypothetical protein
VHELIGGRIQLSFFSCFFQSNPKNVFAPRVLM